MMTAQGWEVAALILLGAFAGVALPALWELRATLRAARILMGTTGKRLDVALETWTTTATRVNGVATALTCTTSGATNGSCSDTTHSVVVAAGDKVVIKTTAASAPVLWTAKMAPS